MFQKTRTQKAQLNPNLYPAGGLSAKDKRINHIYQTGTSLFVLYSLKREKKLTKLIFKKSTEY